MSETETDGSDLFTESFNNPYGYPVIHFKSNDVDSRIFMIQGHHPPIRRIIATFNWIVRNYAIYFLTNRAPDSFLEWGYAKYFANEEDDSIRIELTEGGALEGHPVTFFEV